MAELFHGYRIYWNDEEEQRIAPVSFRFGDILDIRGSKGADPGYINKEPKTYVKLTQDRGIWLVIPISAFRRQWEAYESGDEQFDACDPKQAAMPRISPN